MNLRKEKTIRALFKIFLLSLVIAVLILGIYISLLNGNSDNDTGNLNTIFFIIEFTLIFGFISICYFLNILINKDSSKKE